MGSKKKQTVGYKYFASGHFVLCHGPIDAITKISFQDKDAYLNEENVNKTIYINKSSLFGGDEQQGGVEGPVELLLGYADQQKSSTLQSICAKISDAFGGLISAYRGVCSVVFDNVYIGTAPNMPDSKWRVKRIHTRHDGQLQWYDAKAEINPSYFSGSIDSAYLYNVQDGFSALSQLTPYADVNFNDSSWIKKKGPFGKTIGSTSIFPKENTYIEPVSGRAIMIREKIFVRNPSLIGDLQIDFMHDDGGYLAFNGEVIPLTPVGEFQSTATISNSKIRNGENLIFAGAIDSVPTGGPVGIYLNLSYSSKNDKAIESDINPAHIIRECLTNSVWGIGVSELSIDDDSFKDSADVLFIENMGMSIKWTDSTSINEFVDNIKEHINAQLYLDRVTNKWKLYLIRDDYDIADLISLNESNIRNLDFERRTLAECVNSVTVTYWDRERAKDSTVTVQDIARIAQQGGVISQSVDYKGFTNSDLASRIALRDLKTLSSTLASVSFDVDESFSESWHEGMPFKLSDDSYGLSEAVMRIRTIKRGDGINNTVYVEAIEDSFSSPMQSVIEYVPPITSGDSMAKNADAIAFEVPYIELVEQYGQDEVDAKLLNYHDLGYVGMAAIRPNNQHINASLYVDSGANYDERTTLDFCPGASLKNDIGYMDSSFELENVAEFELLQANNRIQVNDEIMAFVSFDSITNIVTVKRGCFDTVPQKHVSGSKLYGWDNYSGIDDLEYLSGESLSLKALTLTGSDALELNEATARNLTLSSRAIRPYPPANVKINSQYYPQDIETDLILTWVDRNRLQETGGTPLGFFDNGILIEANTQTHLILSQLDENQIELATSNANVTGATSYTMPISTMQANTHFVKVTLKTMRDNYECLQSFDYTVELSQFFSAPYDLTAEFKMTNRLELNWKLDGFVDEQRYYCSETPINIESLPVPKAVLAGDVRTYIDTAIEANKTYYVRTSSVKNEIEKISSQSIARLGDEHFANVDLLIFADSESFPSLNFLDSSNYNRSIYKYGDVSIVAATESMPAKFSNGWMHFNGGRLSTTVNALLTNDFTYETFLQDDNTSVPGNYGRFLEIGGMVSNGKLLLYRDSDNRNIYLQLYSGTYITLQSFKDVTYPKSEVIHLCLMRKNGVFYVFINGALIGSDATRTDYAITQTSLNIGAAANEGDKLYVHMSPIRLTRGVARYSILGFTPPDTKFPIS